MAKYKAYPEYKDSGIEWIREVPVGWNIFRLRHVLSEPLVYGANEAALDDNPYNPRYIRITDMDTNGTLRPDTFKSLPKNIAQYYMLVEGDILLARSGATVGKSFYFKESFGKSCFAGYLIRARFNQNKINPKLAYWFFQSSSYWQYVNGSQIQATIQNVSAEKYGDLYFSAPLEAIAQTKIATFLDHETAKIDNLIEKQQQLIELLKEKRQAVISHAVTKGLNPDVPMKDSGVEWLGEVPEHWGVLRLKHLISSLESGCSVNAADIPAQQGEIAVLKTSCVYTRSFRANENKTVLSEDLHRVKCPVRKGSIIISRMNTPDLVGASALVDVDAENIYLPDRLWQTNFNPKFKLIPAYLAHFMTIQGFRTQISLGAEGASSSMQNIAKDDYLSINCLLPSIEEQQEITRFLEEKLSYFSGLEFRCSEIIQLLQERRTALISAAVTGKIDVRDWVAPDTQEVEEPQETTA